MEVIGTNDKPNNIQEKKIPNSLFINTENKIPKPNIKLAKKSPISLPILLPNQFQNNSNVKIRLLMAFAVAIGVKHHTTTSCRMERIHVAKSLRRSKRQECFATFTQFQN